MTEHAARGFIRKLSTHFRVEPPAVWQCAVPGYTGAYYHPKRREIVYGERPDYRKALCHEFAHHLVWTLDGGHAGEAHAAPFYQRLREVAVAVYGSEAAYPWGSETYAHLKAWARRDGLMDGE